MGNKLSGYLNEIGNINYMNLYESLKNSYELLKERINNKSYKIVVVGEFSSGKSTFINALIGKDILLHAKNETTATITYIHNVDKNDKKENTAEVTYSNGKKKTIDTLEELQKFTTTQSDINVATDISFVDIYVNFLDVKENIIIVDTPGLNGVADKHRTITINEIQKSHACIYLIQLRGITETDVNFLKKLIEFQKTFIFVQNFIDELKSFEGENVDIKLETSRKIIDENIGRNDYRADYCGISALKAVAARDKSVKKLYPDSDELTDDDRKKCWEDSGFEIFLSKIKAIIEDKDFQKQRYHDDCMSVLEFINTIGTVIEEAHAHIEHIKNEDSKTKDIEVLIGTKTKLEENKEKVKKLLDNFIVSSFVEARNDLNKRAYDKLQKINSEMETYIKSENDYDSFKNMIDNNDIKNEIDKKIIEFNNKLNEWKIVLSQNIYKIMLERMDEYSYVSGKTKKFEFEVKKINNFKFEAISERQNIAKKDKEIEKAEKNQLEFLDELNILKKEREDYNKELEHRQNELEDTDREFIENKAKLGLQPAMGRIKREICIEKPIFFGLFSTKERKIVYDNDDTEIRNWNKRKNKIEWDYNNEKKQIYYNLERVEDELARVENLLEDSIQDIEKTKKKIERLKKEKIMEEENIAFKENNMKKEYLSHLKASMISDVEKKLTENLYVIAKENISEDMKKNTEKIKKFAREEYDLRINERIKELDGRITGNETELNKMYSDYSDDIKVLDIVKKNIKEELENE